MSFWDRLGQAWDSFLNDPVAKPGEFDLFAYGPPALAGGTVGNLTPGLTWEAAKANVQPGDRSWKAALQVGLANAGVDRVGVIQNGIYGGLISRPISSYNNMAQQAGLPTAGQAAFLPNAALNYRVDSFNPGRLLDADAWKQAWDESKNVSLGQSEIIANPNFLGAGSVVPGNLTFDNTPEAQAARDAYFRETWAGKLQSGSIDIAANLTLDPVYFGLKGAKLAQVSRLTIKTGEQGAVAAGLRGGEIASKSVERKVRMIDGWIAQTDRAKNAAEIMADPRLANNPAGGYVAAMFDQVNKSFPGTTAKAVEARRSAKLDVLLTLTGDMSSVERLQGRQAQLGDALERISLPPVQTRTVTDWEDYWGALGNPMDGVHPIAKANPPTIHIPTEVENQRTAIMAEMKRLDEIISAQGTVNKVGLDSLETIGLASKQTSLASSTIRSGFFGRPVVILTGAIGNRLEGHVNLRNPQVGAQQLDEALGQARYLTGTDRADILSRWAKAVSDGDRQGVVRAAEAAIVRSTAQHYGLDAARTEELLRAGEGTRRAVHGVMKSRLYSAVQANDSMVAAIDPERDIAVVKSRPVAQSQIEDFHPLVDPRALDRLFQAGVHTRLFENIGAWTAEKAGMATGLPMAAEAAANIGRKAGTRLYSVTDPLVGVTVDALSAFMRLWKDVTLLPRGVAYGARVQMDTQGRMVSHMGLLNYLGALPAQVRNAALTAKDGKLIFKPDTVKVLTPWLTKMGFSEDEAGAILRDLQSQGGNMADLLSNASYSMHQKLLATDNWGVVNTNDPLWVDGYVRAVRQIRHSPIMQEIINGADDDALKQFVHSTPAGRREWLELRGTWEGNLDAYLAEARDHVNHYLPDSTTKAFARKTAPFQTRDVTEEGIRRYFDGPAGFNRRMQIHGEAYSPNTVNKWGKFIADSREHLYTLVADAPETVLGRVPLFVHEFKKEYARILSNMTQGGATVDLELAAKARAQATRIAKNNVAKVLFDSSHTSNLAYHFRLISPFFAAWEDMMKKWGRLFYNKPEMARRFQQAWDAPTDAGITQDEYGNQIRSDGGHYLAVIGEDGKKTFRKLDPKTESALIGKRTMVVVPASFVPKKLRNMVGNPKEFKFDQKSFNVIFQGDPPWLPGSGPLVAIAANNIVRSMFPEAETNPIIRYLLPLGTNDNSSTSQIMPAWARNLKNSGVGPFGEGKDLTQTMDYIYKQEYIKYQQKKRPTEPTLDEISNKARNWFLMRMATSMVSPFSTTPSQEFQFYIDQAKQYKQLYANVKTDPAYQKLLAEYQAKYGNKDADKYLVYEHPEFQGPDERFYNDFPEYFSLYQSLSTNDTGLVANLATVSKMKQYPKEMSKYSEWAWAIAGPDNAYGLDPAHAFSNAAYNYQSVTKVKPGSSATYRGTLPPDEALASAEAAKGWIQYSRVRMLINLTLEQTGISSLSSNQAAPLKALYDQQIKQLGESNPAWLREFGQRDENKAIAFMRDMTEAMNNNAKLAKEPQMASLRQYIEGRRIMMQALQATGAGINAQQNEALATVWGKYVQGLIQNSPGFEQLYNRILEQDALTQEVK